MNLKKQISRVIFAIALLGPAATFLGRWNWIADLFSHFLPQSLAILAVWSMTLIYLNQRQKFIALILVMIFLTLPLLPYFSFVRSSEASSGVISILQSNVYVYNQNHLKLINLIAKENPDIVVVEEIDKSWELDLTCHLSPTYPVIRTIARDDGFGIGVFSKVEIEDLRTRAFCKEGIPSIEGKIKKGNSQATLLATHPRPPITGSLWASRNEQLLNLAQEAAANKGSVILVGDLNTSPWSYWFSRLKSSGLKDSSFGHGIQNSWAAFFPAFLRIPLDHILVKGSVGVLERKVLGEVGSDHFPVLVRLALN